MNHNDICKSLWLIVETAIKPAPSSFLYKKKRKKKKEKRAGKSKHECAGAFSRSFYESEYKFCLTTQLVIHQTQNSNTVSQVRGRVTSFIYLFLFYFYQRKLQWGVRRSFYSQYSTMNSV